MPRRRAAPRLYLDRKRQQWVIRDGENFLRTGCAEHDRSGAESRLAQYLGTKHKPERSQCPLILDVLLVYSREHLPTTRTPRNASYNVKSLAAWWEAKRTSDVNARNCRAYAETLSPAAARRNLETLRAALGYWHREYGPLPALPAVVMPEAPQPRDRWLTRSEAARLLWAARRVPHLRRFILLALYTGSRPGVVRRLQWDQIDLGLHGRSLAGSVDRNASGVMARRAAGEPEDARKRTPRVRLGRRILVHLRRWRRLDGLQCRYVCHYAGRSVGTIKTAFTRAVRQAGLVGVSPHTLRHTRATWMMQEGVPIWEAAGALGMTPMMLERVYGHHHPDWQKRAAEV